MGEGNIVSFCIFVVMAINLFAMGGAQQNVFKTRSGEEDKEQSMFKLTDSLVKDLIERVNQLEEGNRQRQLEISAQNRIILQQQHEINGLKKNMATQVENQYQPDKADVSSMLTEYYDENGSQLNEELSQSANTGPDTGTTDEEVPSRPRRAAPGLEVAFFATLNRTQAHIGRLQSVVFNHVETNIGNGYDQYTGVFSAPTSGVYVFLTTISTLVANSSHYGVFQNGKKKTVMWVNGFQNNYDSSSHTVILKLQKGDDVTIKHTGSDKSVNGDLHSMFSGFLLYQADVGGPSFVGK